jgi:hypothetical protein
MSKTIEPDHNKASEGKGREDLKAIWEYVPTADAEERLLEAYSMLLEKILDDPAFGILDDAKPGEQQRLF